jgi:small subunit ribosomal protein S1
MSDGYVLMNDKVKPVTSLMDSGVGEGSGQDAGRMQDMGELLESLDSMKTLHRGDVIEGVVMRADSDGIMVNIGHKSEGIVPPAEMKTLLTEKLNEISLGDEIVTMVVKPETADHGAILSVDRAVGEKGWKTLEDMCESEESDSTLEGKVIGINRGGAVVEVNGINGFVPMSQLVSIPREIFRQDQGREEAGKQKEHTEDSVEQVPSEDKVPSSHSDFTDMLLELKVLEIDRARNRAIFSERQAVQGKLDERKAQLIQEMVEGETRQGVVTGISSFGAFVDLGGADGLIHISEFSWVPVNSPEEVVKIGDKMDVYVLRVDLETRKIALSLKRLKPEPWQTISEKFQTGDIVNARITNITNFGAFARVEEFVEGLIHVSELSTEVPTHPRDVVSEGDNVKLKIIRIEPERRRIALSLKQAQEDSIV